MTITTTDNRLLQARMLLREGGDLAPFITRYQRFAINSLLAGEEGEFFIKKVLDIKAVIDAMPKTYDTRKQANGSAAMVHLHYFAHGYDAWITEKDMGDPGEPDDNRQHQAYGAARFPGWDAEVGYISIAELLNRNVELDLHWTPKTLKEIM